MGRNIISVFGSARVKEGSEFYELAYRIGYTLGRLGWIVCNGGYGGVMLASAKGCKDAGGKTIGIICKLFSRSGPNEYIDEVVIAEDLFDRLNYLIYPAKGYIILPGGSGTLVELALVWELVAKGLLSKRPIILVGEFWKETIEKGSSERPESKEYITFIDDVEKLPKVLPLT